MPRQIRRGTAAGRVTLAAGELGFSTDTHDIHIGTSAGNKLVTDLGIATDNVRIRSHINHEPGDTYATLGIILDKTSTVAYPHGITWMLNGAPRFDCGMDYELDEYICCYSYGLPGDIIRVDQTGRIRMGMGIGSPASQLAAVTIYSYGGGEYLNGLNIIVGSTAPYTIILENQDATSERTSICYANHFLVGNDLTYNGTNDYFIYQLTPANGIVFYISSLGRVGLGGDTAPAEILDVTGNINSTGVYKIDDVQVVSNRVVDARVDDAINESAWDATTAGVLDALRDAAIAHGLIAAA